MHLFALEFRHFQRTRPHDRLPLLVHLFGQNKSLFQFIAEHALQDFDHVLECVIVVIEQHDSVRRLGLGLARVGARLLPRWGGRLRGGLDGVDGGGIG